MQQNGRKLKYLSRLSYDKMRYRIVTVTTIKKQIKVHRCSIKKSPLSSKHKSYIGSSTKGLYLGSIEGVSMIRLQ